jgi:hypothetical protein
VDMAGGSSRAVHRKTGHPRCRTPPQLLSCACVPLAAWPSVRTLHSRLIRGGWYSVTGTMISTGTMIRLLATWALKHPTAGFTHSLKTWAAPRRVERVRACRVPSVAARPAIMAWDSGPRPARTAACQPPRPRRRPLVSCSPRARPWPPKVLVVGWCVGRSFPSRHTHTVYGWHTAQPAAQRRGRPCCCRCKCCRGGQKRGPVPWQSRGTAVAGWRPLPGAVRTAGRSVQRATAAKPTTNRIKRPKSGP